MGYKTFEDIKHDIPEGATGYREQGKYIEWFSGGPGCWTLIASDVPSLNMCNATKPVKPISRTEGAEENKMIDWKENTLGEMPCKPFDIVDVQFRDGALSFGFASDFYWKMDHDIADIIKYKVRNNKTETPEEKEALDMIDTTLKQVESLANNSESPNSSVLYNGDECVYMNHKVIHQFIGPCPKREGYGYIQAPGYEVNFVELSKLSKPETPEQKTERERLEVIEIMCNEIDRLPHGEAFAAMATLYDLGYRKESK